MCVCVCVGAEGSSSVRSGSKRYSDMHFLVDFVEHVQRYDGAGDKCFLELKDEEQTDETDPGPKYGARCVYEEVKAAIEKKWDILEGIEGVEGWCPHPDPDCVAEDNKIYHFLKWAEYVVKKSVSKGRDYEEAWMTDIKGMIFIFLANQTQYAYLFRISEFQHLTERG